MNPPHLSNSADGPVGGELEMQPQTLVPFLYRDSANYKAHSSINLSGTITAEQTARLAASLSSNETFIPQQVGLGSHLGWALTGFPRMEDDHVWHELDVEGVLTIPGCSPTVMDVEEFVAMFEQIGPDGWDVEDAFEAVFGS